ncbi:dynamin family protein [Salibacterium qingdaonense]|uniref:Small GTP-binding protein domain-containing protein n=1 Tax=Salibacterium qingdaonense TaxID=266892 RepID=A0A1I4K671_9BACI|nr:dynamin family protein [Salibacterium qingdaonense]SFL74295.1 small GTP-binding protein domain-containing protein [Salibacterium qingdaonense]
MTRKEKWMGKKERMDYFERCQFPKDVLISLLYELPHDPLIQHIPALKQQAASAVEKLSASFLTIACCGHFSAGKSTLLNQIMNSDILPSHPVPTSANIVHLQYSTKTLYQYRDTETRHWNEIPPGDDLDTWFLSDHVEELSIQSPHVHLPEHVKIMDTPGMDSTDPLHRRKALSSLSQADIVCCVTDYQHVESAGNEDLLKEINERGMSPKLIVNQVDKHDEQEQSFETFHQNIMDSWSRRRVYVSGVYYVSAKFPDASPGEWASLCRLFHPGEEEAGYLMNQRAALETYRIVEEAVHYHKSKETSHHENERAKHSAREIDQVITDLDTRIQSVPFWAQQFEYYVMKMVDRLFENAKITPYHTRDAAKDYLTSLQETSVWRKWLQPKRVNAALEEAKKRLLDNLRENVQSYIDIPLQQEMQKIMQHYNLQEQKHKKTLFSLYWEPDETLITEARRSGSRHGENYSAVFCRSLAEQVRKNYKAMLREWIPEWKHALGTIQKIETERLQTEYRLWLEAREMRIRIDQKISWLEDRSGYYLNRLLSSAVPRAAVSYDTLEKEDSRFVSTFYDAPSINIGALYPAVSGGTGLFHRQSSLGTAHLADQAVSLIQDMPQMQQRTHSLHKKAERMREKDWRVSLFGSFSAGKSTLANAILGEQVLGVAANPTTACVQRIQFPDREHPHRSVELVYKSTDGITNDMNDILGGAGYKLQTFQDWPEQKENMRNSRLFEENEKEKKHETVETASVLDLLDPDEIELLDMYHHTALMNRSRMGLHQVTDEETYRNIIGRQEELLLIDSATIYYDCEFTRSGCILTDTPGIGSVYRRHSETAFRELKEADALLYVSYYNHAFSKADQEFLKQIGRTKEYFSYDKMFFLVNAADLASSERELQDVLNYAFNQLERLGIASPRVYPVSAGKAVRGEQRTSGLRHFLDLFHAFTEERLQETLQNELYGEIESAAGALKNHQLFLQQKENEKEIEKEKVRKKTLSFQTWIQQYDISIDRKEVEQELDELMFYVKQRVFYRYFDEYKELLHAGRFQKEYFSSQLHRYVNELITLLFHLFAEEVRATMIRMEYFLNRKWKSLQEDAAHAFPKELAEAFVKKDKEQQIPEADVHSFPPDAVKNFSFIQKYRSYRDFFTQGEYKQLKDELEQALRPHGDAYIKKYQDELKKRYADWMTLEWEDALKWYERLADDLYQSFYEKQDANMQKQLTKAVEGLQKLL